MSKAPQEPIRDLVTLLLGRGLPREVCDPVLGLALQHRTHHAPSGCRDASRAKVTVQARLTEIPRRRLCLVCFPGWLGPRPWGYGPGPAAHPQVRRLLDLSEGMHTLDRLVKATAFQGFVGRDFNSAARFLASGLRTLREAPETVGELPEPLQPLATAFFENLRTQIHSEAKAFLDVHADELTVPPVGAGTSTSLGPALLGLPDWYSLRGAYESTRRKDSPWGWALWVGVRHALVDPFESEHLLARVPAEVSDHVAETLGWQDGADLAPDLPLSPPQLEVLLALWPGRALQDALEASRLVVRDSEPLV